MEISLESFCHHFNRVLYFCTNSDDADEEISVNQTMVTLNKNVRLCQFAIRATKVVFKQLSNSEKDLIIKYFNTINDRYSFFKAKELEATEKDNYVAIRILDNRTKSLKSFKYFRHWTYDYLIKVEGDRLVKATLDEVLPTLDI